EGENLLLQESGCIRMRPRRTAVVKNAGASAFAGSGFMASHSRCGKLHYKRGASAGLALAPHAAVHRLDHLLDDGQSQAGGVFAAGGFRAQTREFAEELLL